MKSIFAHVGAGQRQPLNLRRVMIGATFAFALSACDDDWADGVYVGISTSSANTATVTVTNQHDPLEDMLRLDYGAAGSCYATATITVSGNTMRVKPFIDPAALGPCLPTELVLTRVNSHLARATLFGEELAMRKQ